MNCQIAGLIAVSCGLVLAASGLPVAQAGPFDAATANEQPPVPTEELPAGVEVLTRGPVNEAFDQPVTLQAQAGLIAPSRPPSSIEEIPPAGQHQSHPTGPRQDTATAAPPSKTQGQREAAAQASASPAQRDVHLTRPERVKIPTPPIAARPVVESGKVQKAPPPPRGQRRQQPGPAKGGHRQSGGQHR